MSIADRCCQIVVEVLGVNGADCVDDADFIDDLGADSLDMIEITLILEEAYTIEIDEYETSDIETFGNLVSLIERKLH